MPFEKCRDSQVGNSGYSGFVGRDYPTDRIRQSGIGLTLFDKFGKIPI